MEEAFNPYEIIVRGLILADLRDDGALDMAYSHWSAKPNGEVVHCKAKAMRTKLEDNITGTYLCSSFLGEHHRRNERSCMMYIAWKGDNNYRLTWQRENLEFCSGWGYFMNSKQLAIYFEGAKD